MIVGKFEMSAEQREFYDHIARRLHEQAMESDEARETFRSLLSVVSEFNKARALVLRHVKRLDADTAALIRKLTIREMEVFSQLRNEADLGRLLTYGGGLYELGVHLVYKLFPSRSDDGFGHDDLQRFHENEAESNHDRAQDEANRCARPPGQIVSMSPIQSLAPPYARVFKHRMRTQELRLAG